VKACAAFEDRLIDYDDLSAEDRFEVDEHLTGCASCREYLTVLREIDVTLSAQVRLVHLDPQRVTELRQMVTATEPIGRMTRLPEWLDFLAASAVLAFAGGLGWQSGLFALVVNALRVTL
jgi:anti-sigma factor RsiW